MKPAGRKPKYKFEGMKTGSVIKLPRPIKTTKEKFRNSVVASGHSHAEHRGGNWSFKSWYVGNVLNLMRVA